MFRRLAISPSLIASALLLILVWLQLSTLVVTSPTMDEPSHLAAGYAFLTRGDTRIRLNGPILNNLIGAAPLLLEPAMKLTPAGDPAWNDNPDTAVGDPFIFDNSAPPSRLIYMARFPFMAISWLLGALIYRWARERNGASAGLFALTLYVFCPNLLAHSRLAMTDFVPAALTCFALYAFDRLQRQPDRSIWRWVAGVAVGLMLASKFSLITVGVSLPLLTLTSQSPVSLNRRIRLLAVIFGVAGVVVWGVYGFQIKPVVPGGVPVPAPGLWQDVESARHYLSQPPWVNYLLGQVSAAGWWYYFPIALLVKTPLPVLILYVMSLLHTLHARRFRHDLIFLLPSGLLLFSLLFSSNNVGYRYLLPLLPLAFIYVAVVWPQSAYSASSTARWMRWITLALAAWQIVGTLRIYPSYLTFFNEIAGGPDRGRYILSDSNIDWGQDLVGLKNYVDEHHLTRIKLSYFGIAHPTAYGLTTEALLPVRTAMNDQGAWWLHTYYPLDPPPGTYAISVANLMGGIWIDPNEYAFFRDRQPDTTIGNSIYIYTVAPRGTPIDLSLSGLQIDQIDPETYRRFNTNDVRPRWSDAASALIAAPNEAWIAIADNQAMAQEFAAFFDGVTPISHAKLTDENRSYALFHFDLGRRMMEAAQQSEQTAQDVQLPVKVGNTAELLGYDLKRSDRGLTLITYWRAGGQVITPLQMFVHVLGPDGAIVAQQDRLDASPFGWHTGDTFAQVHHLVLPLDVTDYTVEIGLYNPETSARLPVIVNSQTVDNRLVLSSMHGR
jgi:hypothetical protein